MAPKRSFKTPNFGTPSLSLKLIEIEHGCGLLGMGQTPVWAWKFFSQGCLEGMGPPLPNFGTPFLYPKLVELGCWNCRRRWCWVHMDQSPGWVVEIGHGGRCVPVPCLVVEVFTQGPSWGHRVGAFVSPSPGDTLVWKIVIAKIFLKH